MIVYYYAWRMQWCNTAQPPLPTHMQTLSLGTGALQMAETACNVVGGQYVYMRDLQQLEALTGPAATAAGRPCHSPLLLPAWQSALAMHPDKAFRDYILHGLEFGFHIGFDRTACSLRAAKRNMSSCRANPQQVDRYVQDELAANRIIGPIPIALRHGCHISPIGIIPKPHQPGRWRLIVNLSSPEGYSINDGISSSLCSLHYASVDMAVAMVRELGAQTELAKFDLRSAYRVVAIHPDDQGLLGVQWRDQVYLDTALPFGLRSAPKIFSAVADALAWAMLNSGVKRLLHYLDDFLVLGSPNTEECSVALAKALGVCADMGVPVAPEKTEGPGQEISFLGITIDTTVGQLRLPPGKLSRLHTLIQKWSSRKRCRKRQLLSLIGHLTRAATVVPPGRPFLRRMIESSKRATKPHHFLRLDRGFHSDLAWWVLFLHRWNGVSLMRGQSPDVVVTSDASGSWGCGAFSGAQWLQLQWPSCWVAYSIAPKELHVVPVIVPVTSSSLGETLDREDRTLPVRQCSSGCMSPQGFSKG